MATKNANLPGDVVIYDPGLEQGRVEHIGPVSFYAGVVVFNDPFGPASFRQWGGVLNRTGVGQYQVVLSAPALDRTHIEAIGTPRTSAANENVAVDVLNEITVLISCFVGGVLTDDTHFNLLVGYWNQP